VKLVEENVGAVKVLKVLKEAMGKRSRGMRSSVVRRISQRANK